MYQSAGGTRAHCLSCNCKAPLAAWNNRLSGIERAALKAIADWHLIGPLMSEQGAQLLAITKYARENFTGEKL